MSYDWEDYQISLYFSHNTKGLHIPGKIINIRLVAEHLLIVIELFCDIFWAMTGEASMICDVTDELFLVVAEAIKRSD